VHDDDDDEWRSCKSGLKLLGFEQSNILLFVGFCMICSNLMVLQRIHEVMQENMHFCQLLDLLACPLLPCIWLERKNWNHDCNQNN
jgi:hypothetical protein